jgi:hypothetical protein
MVERVKRVVSGMERSCPCLADKNWACGDEVIRLCGALYVGYVITSTPNAELHAKKVDDVKKSPPSRKLRFVIKECHHARNSGTLTDRQCRP